ncbi:MAG: glycosyltransferase family 4 protein [Acidobacteriaceae bacterium]|nr:glycosyltransferase family 4 protein [Acidobacteriaceae bacterium]
MSTDRTLVLHAVTDSISTVLMRGQLAYLREHGFMPAVLASPGEELTRIGVIERIPVFAVAMKREISPLRDIQSLVNVWRLLRRVRPVVCNFGTPKAGLLAGLAAWLTRVPCRVYTLRGLRLETATGTRRILLTFTEKIACACAHHVICVSPSLRAKAVDLGLVPQVKTVVLGAGSSNGVDTGRFARTPGRLAEAVALRRSLGIRDNQFVIGFAARFTRDKGITELIVAFQSVRKIFPDAVLLLVGEYEAGDPVPECVKQTVVQDAGILWVCSTSQIEQYYFAMNLFVLPTHREGMPNTILEAQAAGLPVVTTDATGARDAIENNVTGLLTPVGDVSKLAEAIRTLLSNPPRMQRMGQLGRDRVCSLFRKETAWESLLSFYKSLLAERGCSLAETRAEVLKQCVTPP